MTGTREKTLETDKTGEIAKAVETVGASKNSEKSENGKNPRSNLTQVLYIRYFITFWKKSMRILVYFNLDSKFNAIHPTFAKELGLSIRPIDIKAQKIDDIMLDTFEMIVAAFSLTNNAN